MRTDSPLITIGICAYNSSDTVGRAIDSALAQDWPNIELIVVDDGSSDGTPDVVGRKIDGVKNTRLIVHKKNKTFPGALNTVIQNAAGEFLAIFDDDDDSAKTRVSTQFRRIVSYEEKTGANLVACYASGLRRYPNGYDYSFSTIGSYPAEPSGTSVIDHILFFGGKKGFFYGNGTPSGALMARVSTFAAAGPYDERMFRSEDADFAIRLALRGGHFIGCPEKLVVQYSTGGVEKKPERNYQSYLILIEKYRDYLLSINRYDYALNWNELRFHHFSGRRLKSISTLIRTFFRNPWMTWSHFWTTAPRRVLHEIRMKRRSRS